MKRRGGTLHAQEGSGEVEGSVKVAEEEGRQSK